MLGCTPPGHWKAVPLAGPLPPGTAPGLPAFQLLLPALTIHKKAKIEGVGPVDPKVHVLINTQNSNSAI